MLEATLESLVPLREVPELLPKRNGKRMSLAVVYRWTKQGLRGVRLESTQVGRMRCTSRESLARFFAALSAKDGLTDERTISDPGSPVRSPSRRQRDHQAADTRLAKAGW